MPLPPPEYGPTFTAGERVLKIRFLGFGDQFLVRFEPPDVPGRPARSRSPSSTVLEIGDNPRLPRYVDCTLSTLRLLDLSQILV